MPKRPLGLSSDLGHIWTLLLSGLMGFWMGFAVFPDWQVAVETAQVVGGLVTYPPDTPPYIYHAKLWTGLHQIGALLLRSGVSEIALSKVLSGVLGMVSFQALALFVYAFSRDSLYSMGSSAAIFLSGAAEFGVAYPIFLMGTSHTYGILGLSMLVLVAGLVASGGYRLGGLLLGIAPAVHPALGVWLGVIVAISLAWDFRRLSVELRPALPWFVAGCGLTLVSLILHLALAPDLPSVERALTSPYLSAFVTLWDPHRQPVDFKRFGVFLNLGALTLAFIWLRAFAGTLPRSSLFLLRFVIVSACLGIGSVFVSWIPAERLPTAVIVLMPTRVLNIDAMTFAALLLGLLGTCHRMRWGQLIAVWLFAGLLVGNRSRLWEVLQPEAGSAPAHTPNPLRVLAIALIVFIPCALFSRWLHSDTIAAPARTEASRPARMLSAMRIASLATLVALFLWAVPAQSGAVVLYDRTNAPFFATVAADRGLLLTGGTLHLIQARTRRPVLLDGGGLDGLAYSSEAGPLMSRILQDVYAIDLLDPPEEARGGGVVPPAANRAAWETYSRQKWRDIRRAYRVTQVLTEAGWVLDLPVVAEDHGVILYQIPE